MVYPTSTLPGLGCLPIKSGLDNLFEAKSRPDTMPVSLGVASMDQVANLVEIPEILNEFLSNFTMGGILQYCLPKRVRRALGGANVAIRVFAHPAAIALARECGPITATSANESGVEPECDTELAATY